MRKSIIIFSIILFAIVISMAGFLLLGKSNTFEFENIKNSLIKDEVKIFFAGDAMLDRGIRYYAGLNGGNDFTFEKISNFLLGNDLNVLNLEGPITENPSVSINSKVGSYNNFIFTFEASWAQTLFKNKFFVVGMANNHILNFGERGVESTKNYLTKAGIDYFGAPNGKRSTIKDVKGIKIGFVAYNEFLDDYVKEKNETVKEIEKIKLEGEADLIFVFAHWGHEYEKQPSPVQKEFGRAFIDAGADVVMGAHPHVIQPMEEYKGKRIYYSLGNFIFDQYFSEDVRRGLGVVVKINTDTKELNFEEKNFYLEKNGQTVLSAN